jgi:hypothetical protein
LGFCHEDIEIDFVFELDAFEVELEEIASGVVRGEADV